MIFYAMQKIDIAFYGKHISTSPCPLQRGISPFGGGRGRLRYANFSAQSFLCKRKI
jgi:hypothetical protein